RLLALAGVVVCAAVLPPAVASADLVDDRDVVAAGRADDRGTATAGRAGGQAATVPAGRAGGQGGTSVWSAVRSLRGDDDLKDGRGGRSREDGDLPGGDPSHGDPSHGDSSRGDGKVPSVRPHRAPLLLGVGLATAARCGPEVSSPDGVEAQTCVLNQGEETWARAYYRNTTGEPLDAALTLMGPGDRTVRIRCAPEGDDEPETCETPREHTLGAPAGYTAVAEFARPGGRGPLLLRAGSNAPADDGS
ncbi:hypothetical protein, partial [Kitasatospora sp. NPDC018614]